MDNVYIIGVGMTPFGKYIEKSVNTLTAEAATEVLQDADMTVEPIQEVWYSNSLWGYYTNKH